jgi:hypothetical protein
MMKNKEYRMQYLIDVNQRFGYIRAYRRTTFCSVKIHDKIITPYLNVTIERRLIQHLVSLIL